MQAPNAASTTKIHTLEYPHRRSRFFRFLSQRQLRSFIPFCSECVCCFSMELHAVLMKETNECAAALLACLDSGLSSQSVQSDEEHNKPFHSSIRKERERNDPCLLCLAACLICGRVTGNQKRAKFPLCGVCGRDVDDGQGRRKKTLPSTNRGR